MTTSEPYQGECSVCGHKGLVVTVTDDILYVHCEEEGDCWDRFIEQRHREQEERRDYSVQRDS